MSSSKIANFKACRRYFDKVPSRSADFHQLHTEFLLEDLTARLKFLRCMDVLRYFNNSKYISAGPESNKYKAWWVSQMYGRLSLPAESSHPSDRGHLMRAPCTFLMCANPSQSSALCTLVCAGLFTRTRMRDEMTR